MLDTERFPRDHYLFRPRGSADQHSSSGDDEGKRTTRPDQW